jgi:pilus assembly protein CpaB
MRISRDSLGTACVRVLAFLLVGAGLLGCPVWTRDETPTRPGADWPMKMILVARTKISAYTPITEPEKMFVKAEYPAELAKKAITEFDKVKGQRLNKTLEEAKPVFEDDLMNPDQAGLEAMLKPGQRAISFKVDAVSLIGGWCRPGARVDVYCTRRDKNATPRVILKNLLVLAVDQETGKPDQPAAAPARTVTFAVTPEEAAQLTLGSSVGELRLALRPWGDR